MGHLLLKPGCVSRIVIISISANMDVGPGDDIFDEADRLDAFVWEDVVWVRAVHVHTSRFIQWAVYAFTKRRACHYRLSERIVYHGLCVGKRAALMIHHANAA